MKEPYDLLVPKNGNLADMCLALQKKAKLDDETIADVRFYETHAGKVFKLIDENVSILNINDYVTLYAEKIPEDEKAPEEGDALIDAFHFDKEPSKPHSVPFKFVLKQVSRNSSVLLGNRRS